MSASKRYKVTTREVVRRTYWVEEAESINEALEMFWRADLDTDKDIVAEERQLLGVMSEDGREEWAQ